MFDYTVETSKNMNDAVDSLTQELKDKQFGVLWTFDIKDKLQEKGLDFNKEYKVLEVCNPKEAQKVLTENQMAGYFLPCKMVVYEDGGKTKIGMPRPTSLISMVNDEKLETIAQDIEERLIDCMDKAV
ncbi:DUF302 domain-containing protein [Halobacillus massiliensis]|uniref:DUF302 domain-containing protein n=1 Tax=Halobacillus massiliensis TaxID=1926286 RepID=UPI0009E3CEBB|nr:DUF302 domain-containing protein [Halobacillus massiliensis]